MPSRFEPCGLNQMYSLAYGTVPVVHRTGGLADTVRTWDPASGEGNGWTFTEFSVEAFVAAVRAALAVYRRPEQWHRVMRNGMTEDLSWAASVERYQELYRRLLRDEAR